MPQNNLHSETRPRKNYRPITVQMPQIGIISTIEKYHNKQSLITTIKKTVE